MLRSIVRRSIVSLAANTVSHVETQSLCERSIVAIQGAATLFSRIILKDCRRCDQVKAMLQIGETNQRARYAWRQVGQAFPYLAEDLAQHIAGFLDLELCREDGIDHCRAASDEALRRQEDREEARRRQSWRARWRLERRLGTRYLKEGKAQRHDGIMERPDGTHTGDLSEQVGLVASAWKDILEKHKESEPDVEDFFKDFAPNMARSSWRLEPLTDADVTAAIRAQKPTADGFGDRQANELDIAFQWRPSLVTGLRYIDDGAETSDEADHGLPEPLCNTYTALADKPGETRKIPLAKRPLTVTARLFRGWEATRKDAVVERKERWLHPSIYGGRRGKRAMIHTDGVRSSEKRTRSAYRARRVGRF